MSTYNGEKYIKEQIDSVLSQEQVDVSILIRDDGSTDDTTNIVKTYDSSKIIVMESNMNVGPAESFMTLLRYAKLYDYYAFCDQDDFWGKNKLSFAIDHLDEMISLKGKLYLSSLNVVDVNLKPLFKTKLLDSPSVNPAMVRNQATGCTMVFDEILRKNVVDSSIHNYTMHDSFLYKFAIISGAKVFLDNDSYIKYRQHPNNTLGMSNQHKKIYNTMLNRFKESDYDASNSAIELLKSNFVEEMMKEYLISLSFYKKSLKHKFLLLTKYMIKTNYKYSKCNYIMKVIFNKL